MVIFSIEDSGVGIRKKMLSKLFRIEEHFSTQGTFKESGTGLGLIICKEFVEKHGGKIWVKSVSDQGSQFFIWLPSRVQDQVEIIKNQSKSTANLRPSQD